MISWPGARKHWQYNKLPTRVSVIFRASMMAVGEASMSIDPLLLFLGYLLLAFANTAIFLAFFLSVVFVSMAQDRGTVSMAAAAAQQIVLGPAVE